ncbi:unnamed protein product [Prunus armeniaca]|uniref:Uncharacterized protein n=1 Tax=Prunus armeniaca TaxID=36596 RepID=A0A6J5VY42_PRUAR|nr:unnamed protein product [Prunus armeniaca]
MGQIHGVPILEWIAWRHWDWLDGVSSINLWNSSWMGLIIESWELLAHSNRQPKYVLLPWS